MKTLLTLLSIAALAACVSTPSEGEILARLKEIRAMPCDELSLKIHVYSATMHSDKLNASGHLLARNELASRGKK